MPKKIALLSLFCVSTFVLTSCSDDSKVIHFYLDKYSENKITQLNEAVKEFNKIHPEYSIKLENQGYYNELKEKINKGLASNKAPDLALAYQDHVSEYLKSKNNLVIDMKPYIDADKDFNLADIPQMYDENLSIRSKGGNEWYILPFAKSTEAVYYNKKLIDYYNEKNPSAKIKQVGELGSILKDTKYDGYYNTWTWTEFFDIAEKLQNFVKGFTESDKETLIEKGLENVYNNKNNFFGISFDSADNTLIQEFVKDDKYITSSGSDATSKLIFLGSEKANSNKILKKYYDYKQKGIYRGRINTTDGKTRVDLDSAKGLSAFVVASTSHTKDIADEAKKNNTELGLSMRPSDSAAPKVISQGPSLVMFRQPNLSGDQQKEKQQAVFDFVKILTSANFSASYSTALGYLPVRISSYDTDTMKNYLKDETKPELLKEAIRHAKATLLNKTLVYEGLTPGNSQSSPFKPSEGEVLKYFFTESFVGSDNVRSSVKTLFNKVSSETNDDVVAWINGLLDTELNELKKVVKN